MPKNPKEYIVAPKPNDPRLTRKLDGIDHKGNLLTTAVVTEKPLTVFLNGQEIVTLMTIGDEPELLQEVHVKSIMEEQIWLMLPSWMKVSRPCRS